MVDGIKILLCANTSWYIWNFRRKLILDMLEDGHQIVVTAPEDAYSRQIRALGCTFVPLEMDANGAAPQRDFALYLRMRRLLKTHKPDVIFSWTIKCNIYLSMAARWQGIPIVPNVSGLGTAFLSDSWVNRIVRMLYRFAFHHPKIVFFQNQDDQRTFLDLGLVRADQVRLLPGSGVDLTRFSPQPIPTGNGVTFLLVARMLWDKGVGEFVEAAKQIRQKLPDIRFQLLGAVDPENPRAIPRETLDEWGQDGVIEYLGETDDVRTYISTVDCVALPSYREGTPRSLLEAAAMARPVITTDAPGCRNVVELGRTGFLCAPRSIESLVEAIEKFIALSHAEKTEMGHLGRQKMEQEYDESIVISAYRQVIEELTRSKRN